MPRPMPSARCLDCDYLLHGLHEARCPECGRGFDLGDPATYHTGRPMPLFVRSWLKPIGGPTLVLAGSGWLGLSWFAADPEFNYMCVGPALLVLLWPVLGVVIGIRAAFRMGLLARYQRPLNDFGDEDPHTALHRHRP